MITRIQHSTVSNEQYRAEQDCPTALVAGSVSGSQHLWAVSCKLHCDLPALESLGPRDWPVNHELNPLESPESHLICLPTYFLSEVALHGSVEVWHPVITDACYLP
jgi:hypothetical protein